MVFNQLPLAPSLDKEGEGEFEHKRASILRWLWIPAFAGMTIFLSSAWATPPTTLDLTYDPATGVLHVEAKHISDHLDKHYLRRLVIDRNGAKEKEIAYTRQKYPSKFVEDIPFIAKPGETIAVEVFCSQGGKKKVELTIDPTSPTPADTPPALNPTEWPTPETPSSPPKSTY